MLIFLIDIKNEHFDSIILQDSFFGPEEYFPLQLMNLHKASDLHD